MRGSSHLRFGALVAVVFLLGVESGSAEEPVASPAPRRAASWVTEILAAELPKYEARTVSEDTEVSTADEPAVEKDGVLSLPTMRVRPVLREAPTDYSFLTAKGRLELAQKTHPGIRVGNILGLNNGIALFMQMEEQEVRKKNNLLNRVQSSLLDTGQESKALLRLIKEATVRPNSEWLYGRDRP